MNYGVFRLQRASELFLANPCLQQLAALKLISYYEFHTEAEWQEESYYTSHCIATDCQIMQIFGCNVCPFRNNKLSCELLAALSLYKPGQMKCKRNRIAEKEILPSLIISFAQLQGLIDYVNGDNDNA